MKNNFEINEQPSPLNNNYENIQNNQVIALTRYCKTLSISYLITWISCIIFMIGAIVCYIGNGGGGYNGSGYYTDYETIGFKEMNYMIQHNPDLLNNYPLGAPSLYAGFIACIVFVAILGLALLVLGFYLISVTGKLKNYYEYSKDLSTLFTIGLILFGFTSIIASILTILDCKKIESKNSISYSQSGTLG